MVEVARTVMVEAAVMVVGPAARREAVVAAKKGIAVARGVVAADGKGDKGDGGGGICDGSDRYGGVGGAGSYFTPFGGNLHTGNLAGRP